MGKAFGGGAATCFRMQAAYNLAQAMKQAGKSKLNELSALPQPEVLPFQGNH